MHGIYSWGLIPGLTDCTELLVAEKTAERNIHFAWFSPVHKLSSSESLFEIVRKAKKTSRFKQTLLPWGKLLPSHHQWCKGQNIPCQERAKGCSDSSSSSWSSRQKEKSWLFLLTMAGCAWGSEDVFGGAGQFLEGEREFTKKVNSHASYQHSDWTYFSSLTSVHLVLCRIFFSPSCHTIAPFFPIIIVCCDALPGRTQEVACAWAVTLKDALDAILLKLGPVHLQAQLYKSFSVQHMKHRSSRSKCRQMSKVWCMVSIQEE